MNENSNVNRGPSYNPAQSYELAYLHSEKGLINKALSPEIFLNILQYMEDMDFESAAIVSRLWSAGSILEAKKGEALKFADFNNFLIYQLQIIQMDNEKNPVDEKGLEREGDLIDVGRDGIQHELAEITVYKDIINSNTLLTVRSSITNDKVKIAMLLKDLHKKDLDALEQKFKEQENYKEYGDVFFLANVLKQLSISTCKRNPDDPHDLREINIAKLQACYSLMKEKVVFPNLIADMFMQILNDRDPEDENITVTIFYLTSVLVMKDKIEFFDVISSFVNEDEKVIFNQICENIIDVDKIDDKFIKDFNKISNGKVKSFILQYASFVLVKEGRFKEVVDLKLFNYSSLAYALEYFVHKGEKEKAIQLLEKTPMPTH